ncbi:Sulfhydryl oxidase 1 [Lamellibrachia satsuma]|nr:Sulfhydryl oxidase 1 [Lamellibrachia satsuma]
MALCLITFLSLICLSPVFGEADSDGLFSSSDAVAHLDSSNFKRTVTGTDHAWFVDFYSIWCGHCVRFAPVYKAFGSDIEDWYKVIRVGAIACSSSGNSPTCRRYDIWGYPTVKFFPPKSADSHKGTSFNGDRTADDLRKKALDYLLDWLKTHSAPASWPKLTPYRSISEFVSSCGTARHRFLVADNDKYLAREVILDFSYAHPGVCVGQMKRSDARRAGISSFPSLNLVTSSEQMHTININGGGRKAMATAIRSILNGHYDSGVSSPQTTQKTPAVNTTYLYTPPDGVHNFDLESAVYYSLCSRPPDGVHNFDLESAVYYSLCSRPPDGVHNFDLESAVYYSLCSRPPDGVHNFDLESAVYYSLCYRPPDGVHNFDLESAVYYSLWLEIGTHQIIDGERLAVLKHYIDILSRYYPGPELVHSFLNKTNTWLKGVSTSLVGQQWLNRISNMQDPGKAFVLNKERWAACKGSQPRFRGYPCSLWTLFHAITVNAEQIERQNSMFDPKEVPVLMNDYIQQFFGCRECAVNFGKGARRINTAVSGRTDAILWLWKSHNRANHWLHKDPTEDPQQAKIQFPSYKACALCRRPRSYDLFDNRTVWDDSQVLQYLTHFYAKEYIQDTSTDDQSGHSGDTGDVAVNPRCTVEVTEWSACSLTCGVGTSHRMSNNNNACLSRIEYRVCHIRPCGVTNWSRIHARRLDQCFYDGATYQLMQPQPLRFGSCHSLSVYYFRFCGSCPNQCCYPVSGRTVTVPVVCNNSYRASVKMFLIEKCNCDYECPDY